MVILNLILKRYYISYYYTYFGIKDNCILIAIQWGKFWSAARRDLQEILESPKTDPPILWTRK